ncbi:MAG: molybdopterin-guanine dinucleotide biosynthesis protein B [Pirellulaceae bacterium]|jgi:molybdopterin-guanine dinucleotide biosynthesis protein MobB|nr:molybdopterin-guanine dinucleotide biosynthesis protein B [Pirellulaceae bacterium]MDP7304176.1 molybdopterin-guanine dinucleotide biosynthesis protein B [Pirellulaceae bacterium]HJN10559.1 molybdopterin-guanine dinucleotide biosynthesis protein B [Pirellulaceae bacterium]
MKRVHIVGRKNSGKTTLIVDLVQHLTARGCRVGTIKHTHHHHELDTSGKDSHRHREAGAAVVGILSPDMSAVFRPRQADASDTASRYANMAPLFAGCDVVLVEGNLQTTSPKIEVWRAATETSPLAGEDTSIAAVITDDTINVQAPVWKRSEIATVATHLLTMLDWQP